LFLADGAALLVYILAGISLRWTAITVAVAALVIGAVVVRRMSPPRRRRFARRAGAGAIAGFVAIIAYDVARYGLVEIAGMTVKPFEAWRLFGLALTGTVRFVAAVVRGAGDARRRGAHRGEARNGSSASSATR
jgi:hypothetical protein